MNGGYFRERVLGNDKHYRVMDNRTKEEAGFLPRLFFSIHV